MTKPINLTEVLERAKVFMTMPCESSQQFLECESARAMHYSMLFEAFEVSMALSKQLVGVLGNIKRINENALLAGASRADIQEFSRKTADAAIYAAQAHGIKE